ncbi:hypothetical protein EV715DRAFT_295469 [Schizophyllum commune]
MSAEKRDPDRRRESKKAYYQRHKERLREERALRAYRTKHAVDLRLRQLNQTRRLFIQQHGVAIFREKFVSRLSKAAREKIPWGWLLEDHDDEELDPIYTYYTGPR